MSLENIQQKARTIIDLDYGDRILSKKMKCYVLKLTEEIQKHIDEERGLLNENRSKRNQ